MVPHVLGSHDDEMRDGCPGDRSEIDVRVERDQGTGTRDRQREEVGIGDLAVPQHSRDDTIEESTSGSSHGQKACRESAVTSLRRPIAVPMGSELGNAAD